MDTGWRKAFWWTLWWAGGSEDWIYGYGSLEHYGYGLAKSILVGRWVAGLDIWTWIANTSCIWVGTKKTLRWL
eukprot:254342-Prorocentrum_lima.AAC.1